LLLASVVEAAVRTVTSPNLVLTVIRVVHVFVGLFRLLLTLFALIEDSKLFISVYGYK